MKTSKPQSFEKKNSAKDRLPDSNLRIIGLLEAHLGALMVLFHQLKKHQWFMRNSASKKIRRVLMKSGEILVEQMDLIADRVLELGGCPTGNPVEQYSNAYISPEEEGYSGLGFTVGRDLDLFHQIRMQLDSSIRVADQSRDVRTSQILKQVQGAIQKRIEAIELAASEDALSLTLPRRVTAFYFNLRKRGEG